MLTVGNNTKECYVCHCLVETVRNFSMFFPELNGCPNVCSSCVFKAITGDTLEWDESFKSLLKIKRGK